LTSDELDLQSLRGFHDHVGPRALARQRIAESFLDLTRMHGFELAHLSPVGRAEPFLRFGSAARERCFAFRDRKGRQLVLAPDTIPSILRAYLATRQGSLRRPLSLATAAQVFRYRRKKYRCWTQLVATVVNETTPLAAEVTLLALAYDFATRYWPASRIVACDYGVVDAICRQLSLPSHDGRDTLYRLRKGGTPEPGRQTDLVDLVQAIEHATDQAAQAADQVGEVRRIAPWLAPRLDYLQSILDVAAATGLPLSLSWRPQAALDYHADLAWRILDGRRLVGDGGGYGADALGIAPGVTHCWSLAFSADAIADGQESPQEEVPVHAVRLDCSAGFFARACAVLRRHGLSVRPIWQARKLRNTVAGFPPDAPICIVGLEEEARGAVHVREGSSGIPDQKYAVPS